MDATDMREFRQYLKQCTDKQVRGVYEFEMEHRREDYAELAKAEGEARGFNVEES